MKFWGLSESPVPAKTQILLTMMGLLAANGRAFGSVKLRGEEILNLPCDKLDQHPRQQA